MKKGGILNKELASVIAGIGHTDMLLVCDAGFPVPNDAHRIDLVLCEGKPGFLETISVILRELAVEKVIAEQETKERNEKVFRGLEEMFRGIPMSLVTHAEFKNMRRDVKAIVRTGEFTPYANVILVGGVVY